MSVIEIEDIRKYYQMGDNIVKALDGVTFSIETSEMLAITGPSGSGKSTLMHILGCLGKPDKGSYLLNGHNVENMDKNELATIRNKMIGFIFQSFNLLPRLSALENVELPLLYQGVKNPKKEAKKALERVDLGTRMHHEPRKLSGGQRQRVAIARALVTDPAILLADEPTGNLDSRTGKDVMGLFKQLNEEGRTVIIVTHEPEIADYCKRQVHIRDGLVDSDFTTNIKRRQS